MCLPKDSFLKVCFIQKLHLNSVKQSSWLSNTSYVIQSLGFSVVGLKMSSAKTDFKKRLYNVFIQRDLSVLSASRVALWYMMITF